MAFEITTKDTTALTDAELDEMAALAGESGGFELGTLSKEKDLWVLVTFVREDEKLRAYSYSTLERIGGTPCILLGLGYVKRYAKREAALKALMHGNYHRALMAFPDEDVLVGTRMADAGAFDAFKVLSDIVPRPGHRASGEEKQWGRRLVKRFGVDPSTYDSVTFSIDNPGVPPVMFDFETSKPDVLDADVVKLFERVDSSKGDALIALGWVMSEELLKYPEI